MIHFFLFASIFVNVIIIGWLIYSKKQQARIKELTSNPKKEVNHTAKDVADFYNRTTDSFIKVYGQVIQAFRTKEVSKLLDYQIEAMGLKKGMRVLDAGCGVGGPSTYFVEHAGVEIDALTISEVQANLAQVAVDDKNLKSSIHIKIGDFHELDKLYPENTFDVVFFLESFGHAYSHEKVLDAVWKVLKPGGKVYIKDLFVKASNIPELKMGIDKEVENINKAYHYNIPQLNTILHHLRSKGYILSQLKTIDIPLEDFENLTISNEFQELTGINKIDNLRNYIFPVEFYELLLIKPDIDPTKGSSRYFLQNMYLMQIENWKLKDL